VTLPKLWVPVLLVSGSLAPIAVSLIDGFLLAPWQFQALIALMGIAFVVVPTLFLAMLPVTAIQNLLMTSLSFRQSSWSAKHVLRAMGPSAALSTAACLACVLLSSRFDQGGGGWFVFFALMIDIGLGAISGLFVRDVIRRRGDTRSALKALAWLLCFVGGIAGAKLFITTLSSAHPISLAAAYRIAWVLDLVRNGRDAEIALFVASQTPSFYWLLFSAVLLLMLSISALARFIGNAFNLALSTISPFEILATYMTAVAGIAALMKSLLKIAV
jgi:hypothetical protein